MVVLDSPLVAVVVDRMVVLVCWLLDRQAPDRQAPDHLFPSKNKNKISREKH